MEEYNLKQAEQVLAGAGGASQQEAPSKYMVGFLTGLGLSLVLAGIVAAISIWMESVYSWLVVIATFVIGLTVQGVSNRRGFVTALMSAICGAFAVVVFTIIMEAQGYCWDDGTSISDDMTLYMILGALLCGWAGWKNFDND